MTTKEEPAPEWRKYQSLLHHGESPYAHQSHKSKKRSRPTTLLPLNANQQTMDPLHYHAIALKENIVVKAILHRQDTLEHVKAHFHQVTCTRDMDLLRIECCRATVNVVLALKDWHEQLESVHSFGRIFVWQEASYIHTLTTDYPELKAQLASIPKDEAVVSYPFFLPKPFDSFLTRKQDSSDMDEQIHESAKFLFGNTEFIAIWKASVKKPKKYTIPRHLPSENPFLNRIRPSQVHSFQQCASTRGINILRQALGILQLNVNNDMTSILTYMRQLDHVPIEKIPSIVILLTKTSDVRPARLYQECPSAAYICLWLLHLVIQQIRRHKQQTKEEEAGYFQTCRFTSGRNLVRLVEVPGSIISISHLSLSCSIHTNHSISRQDLLALSGGDVSQPKHSRAFPELLKDYLLGIHHYGKFRQRELSGRRTQLVRLRKSHDAIQSDICSMDILTSTTLAEARSYLDRNYLGECPQGFKFLYRGSLCPISLESKRRVLDAIAMETTILYLYDSGKRSHRRGFLATAETMLAHYLFIPIRMALDEKRRREEQERLAALARMPRPRTSLLITIEVDVPMLPRTSLRIPSDPNWTLTNVLEKINAEYCISIAEATHEFYWATERVPPAIQVVEYFLENENSILKIVHKRIDIHIDISYALHVEQSSCIVRQYLRVNEKPCFDHWSLDPGDEILLSNQTYKIVRIEHNHRLLLDRPYMGKSACFVRGQKIMRGLLRDPRLQWEVDNSLFVYIPQHRTFESGMYLTKRVSVERAIQQLGERLYLIQPYLRSISLDWFEDYIYDDLCNSFPISIGITQLKFSNFVKTYDLLGLVDSSSSEKFQGLFDRFLIDSQKTLLKPAFCQALRFIGELAHDHLYPNALEMDPQMKLIRFFFDWFLSHAKDSTQDGVFSYATELALSDHIKEECATLVIQSIARMRLQYTRFRQLKSKSTSIQKIWRGYNQRQKYLNAKRMRENDARDSLEFASAVRIVMALRRRIHQCRGNIRIAARQKIDAKLGEFRDEFYSFRGRMRCVHPTRVVALLEKKTRSFVRLILQLHTHPLSSMTWLTAYNPITSQTQVLPLTTTTKRTIHWIDDMESLILRLEMRDAQVRLTMKEHATRQGRRIFRFIQSIPVAVLPHRHRVTPCRFIIEGYQYTDEIVLQLYSPRDSSRWRWSKPSSGTATTLLEILAHLKVIPSSDAAYTIDHEDIANRVIQEHVVCELQRHIRRQSAQRRAKILAMEQWLRIQVKNKYQYLHRYSGEWRTTKPSMLRGGTPTNPILEWTYIVNYNNIRLQTPYYIYPRKAKISLYSETQASTIIQNWYRKHHRKYAFVSVQ